MTSSDPLLDRYYALKPAEFGYLEHLEIRQPVQPEEWCKSGLTLTIRLRSSATPGSSCLQFEFNQVRGLSIGPFDGLLRYFFEIRSIRAWQWERLNYRVVESEYNALAFDCRSFVATIVES